MKEREREGEGERERNSKRERGKCFIVVLPLTIKTFFKFICSSWQMVFGSPFLLPIIYSLSSKRKYFVLPENRNRNDKNDVKRFNAQWNTYDEMLKKKTHQKTASIKCSPKTAFKSKGSFSSLQNFWENFPHFTKISFQAVELDLVQPLRLYMF